jgi:hypothetical protein
MGKGSVDKIIHQLGYSKVCARWVPRNLTEEHKQQRKAICSELLARYEVEGDDFLSIIVTGVETWIHHLAPSDYHLFGPLKGAIRGKRFEDDEEVIAEVKRWLPQRPAEWYREGIHALASRWRKAKHSEGDYVKNRFR